MISAVVLAKNEEKNIVECLGSLSFCDEVLVVDDNSDDRTVELAKKNGAKVVEHTVTDFASQRNYALDLAKGEWVLFVDADERVTDELKKEIQRAVMQSDGEAYSVRREDIIWGRRLKYGDSGGATFVRLSKKHSGHWKGKVHERWNIVGKIVRLQNPLLHYPHSSIGNFLSEINHYSTLRANELKDQHVRTNAFLIILYPKAKFFYLYILKLGFLDGMEGLVSAIMMSLYSFLVRGKLWLLWRRKSE